MTGILLVRHAQTSNDVGESVVQGWGPGSLTAAGDECAMELGRRVAPAQPRLMFTSDLLRALKTACGMVHGGVTLRPLQLVGLRPWNLGAWQGRKEAEAKPELWHAANDCPDEPAPGGESFNEFKARYFRCLGAVADEWKLNGGFVVCVTHSRNIELTKVGVTGDMRYFLSGFTQPCDVWRLHHDGSDWGLDEGLGA